MVVVGEHLARAVSGCVWPRLASTGAIIAEWHLREEIYLEGLRGRSVGGLPPVAPAPVHHAVLPHGLLYRGPGDQESSGQASDR